MRDVSCHRNPMAKYFASKGRRLFGLSRQGWIKGFFGGSAGVSFGVIFLIFLFLLFEALRFFPSHHRELKLAQNCGQEYVDSLIREASEYQQLVSYTNQGYSQELDARFGSQRGFVDGFEILQGMIEDGADAEMAALDEAREASDPEALATAEARYREVVGRIVREADRTVVDSFGRLAEDETLWRSLLGEALSYDAVKGVSPGSILKAESEMRVGMSAFQEAKDLIASAGGPLKKLRDRLVGIASQIKTDALADRSAAERKEALLEGAEVLEGGKKESQLAAAEAIEIRSEFPFAERVAPILEAHDEHQKAVRSLERKLREGISKLPVRCESETSEKLVEKIRTTGPAFLVALDESVAEAGRWNWEDEVGWGASVTKFIFGKEWKTASDWRQVYGFLPLFTGSVIISMIAVLLAVPFSIGAAIYVNQLSSKWEQAFMKPAIEMIQAIPSIVLGFFGIMVLGNLLVEYSASPLISWLPGFPITERLNMLNAGMLLALMAVPTIFTLCEDALNNVPRSLSEASMALGASKLQTVNRAVVPAALSGILAAVLLGLGRVIGETMVVLLVAGNKIAMPDWGAGLGVITQPAHTMTGIIAQEMGDVSAGTLHYRALFLIGLVLFTVSLSINLGAQKILKRLGSHV